jgi:hypothetical protein
MVDKSINPLDQSALQTLALRVISDPSFRKSFSKNPSKAIDATGLVLDAKVKTLIIKNAKHASAMTAEMDNVTAAFFFWYSK